MKVASVWWRAMALSGALAGNRRTQFRARLQALLRGMLSRRAPDFSASRSPSSAEAIPIGVVLAALVFATISQGGLAVNAVVPKQIVDVLQAVVIIAVAASVPDVRACCAERRR